MTTTKRVGPAARVNKGHPRKALRYARAMARLADHVYDPEKCGPNCPKKENA